eukprot:s732_g16.t1
MALGIWTAGLDTLEDKVKSVQERFESEEPWVEQLVAVHYDGGALDVDDFVSQLSLLNSPQTRRLQRCATPDCPFRVHECATFGGYCCKQCHFVHVRGKTKGPQHGGRCEGKPGSHLSLQALARPPLKPQTGVGCVVAGFSSLQRVERVAKPVPFPIAEPPRAPAKPPKAQTSEVDVLSRGRRDAGASRARGSPQEGAAAHDRSSSAPGGGGEGSPPSLHQQLEQHVFWTPSGLLLVVHCNEEPFKSSFACARQWSKAFQQTIAHEAGFMLSIAGSRNTEDDVDYGGLRDAVQAACSYTSSWPGVFLHQVSVDCDGKQLTALGETEDASLQQIVTVARRKKGERCLAGQPTGKRKREDMADVVENLKGLFAHFHSEQLSMLRDLVYSVESPAKQQKAGPPKAVEEDEEFEEVEISEEEERRCKEKIERLKAERARQMAFTASQSQSRRNKAPRSSASASEAMPAPGDAGEDVRGGYLAPTPKQKVRPRPSSAPQISATTPPEEPKLPPPQRPKPKPMPCKAKKLVPKEPPYPPPSHLTKPMPMPPASQAMRAGMKVLFTSPFSPDTRITAEPQFEKLAEMKESLQRLAAGPSIRQVPVDEINFTQSSCGERFSDGRTFFELLTGLWNGDISLSADFLVLNTMETSAGISSFNNRRLYVLKQYQKLLKMAGTGPEEEVLVWCKIRPLDPNLEAFVEMKIGEKEGKKQATAQLNLLKDVLLHQDAHLSKDIRVRYKS